MIYDHKNNFRYAPKAWKKFIQQGKNGIKPLKAPRIIKIPTKYEQLQASDEGLKCLDEIRNYYKENPTGFESCAVDIIEKMNPNFLDFSITRPWRDGGRDAFGYYQISQNSKWNYPLKIDCSLEAKCYSKDNSVGVKQMSRLISRIRYRQFGIMVTTSYVDSQAYKEVVEDGHPILIVTASDIAVTLKRSLIDMHNIDEWLASLD